MTLLLQVIGILLIAAALYASYKRRTALTCAALLLLIVPVALSTVFHQPAQNPDPNHTHADFAVWVNGTQLDFSDAKYMSGSSEDEATHPQEGLRKYLHLHDGNGHMIHRHKPGLTFGDFLASIDHTLSKKPDGTVCMAMPGAEAVCSSSAKQWRFFVNGKEEQSVDPAFVFSDGDQLLLTFGADDTEVQKEIRTITGDACKYSKTCPWKGAPPTENCIADPTVPCVGV